MNYNIRKAEEKDIDKIVVIHLLSFPGFFLTFLGPSFLGLLYSEIMKEPGSISLVCVTEEKEIVGFVVGVENQVGLYNRLAKSKWFSFAIASLRTAILNPPIIPRLFRALTQSSKVTSAACPALLMSIGVSSQVKGKGIGSSLITEFKTSMANRDVTEISLTTDRDNNFETNQFYLKNGFSLVRMYQTYEGRWMNEYIIKTKSGI